MSTKIVQSSKSQINAEIEIEREIDWKKEKTRTKKDISFCRVRLFVYYY